MTKPAPPPSRKEAATVVEIDAIDVAEWQHDQHTPLAPSAGLAALVRQTLPQPSTTEPRREPEPPSAPAAPAASAAHDARANALAVVRRIAAQARSAPPLASHARSTPQAGIRRIAAQVRGAPPRVPPAPTPPSPPAPLASSSPMPPPEAAPALLASPLPMPPPEPTPPLANPSPVPTPPPLASPSPVPTPPPLASPLPVPPPEQLPPPLASLSPMPPQPMRSEASHRVTTESDTAPVPQPLSRAASTPSLDHSTSAMIRSWFASRRVVVIAGATVALLVLIIAVAATRNADPGAMSAMSAAPKASRTSTQNGTPAPRPTHDTVGPPPPSTRDTPPAASAAPPPPQTLRDTPEPPSAATKPSPRATPPAPGSRVTAKTAAVPPAKHDAPVETEDGEPATARARTAYNAGNQALFNGQSDAAIRAYRQALSAAPTFAPGFRGLGLAFAQRGETGSAVMALRLYLNMAPHAKDAALIKQRIEDLSH